MTMTTFPWVVLISNSSNFNPVAGSGSEGAQQALEEVYHKVF